MSDKTLKKTVLYDRHAALGARLVEFGGWEMPVQYSGIVDEHRAVRSVAGLFDVSHMGQFEISGPGAARFLQYIAANDIEKLDSGGVHYSMFLNKSGGTIDDIMVYRTGKQAFLVVVNASNTDKDWVHVSAEVQDFDGVQAKNSSADYALLALQGPQAEAILSTLTSVPLGEMKFHEICSGNVAGQDVMIATTGYTGENGYEIFASPAAAGSLWDSLLEGGAVPAGLGARDTLRLEASLPLYGHELDEETSPIEANLGFAVAKSGSYIGAEAIRAQRNDGVSKKLVMLEMIDRGIPRQGYPVLSPTGDRVGIITSGSVSPWFQKQIAMAYVAPDLALAGQELQVEIRGRGLKASVVKRPYYKRPKR